MLVVAIITTRKSMILLTMAQIQVPTFYQIKWVVTAKIAKVRNYLHYPLVKYLSDSWSS